MAEPVAWAVVFVADEADPQRMHERMAIFKDHGHADHYAGDHNRSHDPQRVRPLGFIDGGDDDDAIRHEDDDDGGTRRAQ